MNRNQRITIIILTFFAILISWFILDDEIKSFHSEEEDLIIGFLLSIRFFFLNALLVAISVYSVIRIIKKRIFGYFIPLVFCFIHFTIVITLRIKLNLRESSPIILQAHYDGDINGLTIYLRQNKTYKLSDFAIFGGTNHYGEYQIIGDTILLSEQYPLGANRNIMSNKLLKTNEYILIKPDSAGNYNPFEYVKLRIVK